MKHFWLLIAVALCATSPLKAQTASYYGLLEAEMFLVYNAHFNDPGTQDWPLRSNSLSTFFKAEISGGRYAMLSELKQSAIVRLKNLSTGSDFQIEGEVVAEKVSEKGHYGLCFGDNGHGQGNTFTINSEGQFRIEFLSKGWATLLTAEQAPENARFDPTRATRLTVRRHNGQLLFFVNKNLVYECSDKGWVFSNEMGFISSPYQKIFCDNFTVWQLETCREQVQTIIEMNALFATQIAAISGLRAAPAGQHPAYTYLGDARSEIGVKLCNVYGENARFKLTVSCPEIMDESTLEGKLDEEFRTYELFPALLYRLADVGKIRQPKTLSVDFKLYINGQQVLSRREYPTFYPYSVVPTHFAHRRGGAEMLTGPLAACVNEFNPAIQQYILPVLEKEWPYKTGHYDKAAGLFFALQEQGIRYASNMVSDNTGTTMFQEYKTPDRVLLDKSGNCLDLSILLASALKKCNIPAFLITKPNHAQVGFTTEDGAFYVIEATQVDNQMDMEALAKLPGFKELETANKEFLTKRKEKLSKKEYLALCRFLYYCKETNYYTLSTTEGTTIIPIDLLRTEGIRPTMYVPTK